jgi:hypothetical protein
MSIRALLGRPYVDLEPWLDLRELDAIHDEVCVALTQLHTSYTGGSHRSMGIVPPSLRKEPVADYGEVIAAMSDLELETFLALGDDRTLTAASVDRRAFGEEREHALSARQMRWLEVRHRVYFPWKAYYELIPNGRWEDKSTGIGLGFTDEARRLLPRTVAFCERLPFSRIGRCNLLGIEANDHGTVHRDGDAESETPAEHFITLCPRGDKRLFLWDESKRQRQLVRGRAYWFDDRNYHGVAPDPFFRYSIRVDGVFRPEFLARLEAEVAA